MAKFKVEVDWSSLDFKGEAWATVFSNAAAVASVVCAVKSRTVVPSAGSEPVLDEESQVVKPVGEEDDGLWSNSNVLVEESPVVE